ncbi:MAG: pyridoxal phosphate-dependent aminotransferase [Dehalococcoidia bacterium]|nr:aspartate aminotransferase [Chloroflexota bacterium]MDP6425632.1 pyridoxal phosphate-dependent aminotransferase [Dehalococcoidia bacterium]MDP7613210.1 pyridoxal phosphate-dependent aminotransferase [Dehalococcoidia bacterium]
MPVLANRQKLLGTETAFETLAKAKRLEAEGKNIIHLEIGEPDFDTPYNIKQAAKKAIDDGYTHYGPSAGQMELRQTIANHQSSRQGYDISPENVIVTPGAKPIMFYTVMALINPGDEAIYPNPGFPIYESMINYVGGVAKPMRLKEETNFNVDIKELESLISDRTRLIIVNSPNNPCGSVIPNDDLKRISDVADAHDLIVLSDEIYKDMYYDRVEHCSITKFGQTKTRTVILDGFSKSYAMTGWRLGYGVFPDFMIDDVSKLVTNSVSCTSVFTQIAGIEALEGPQDSVSNMMKEFTKRREIVVDGLNSLKGIRCSIPKGAFYAFPNIENTGMTSQQFADKALYDGGVALLSGTSFGEFGEGFIRISFANSIENIQEGIKRISTIL